MNKPDSSQHERESQMRGQIDDLQQQLTAMKAECDVMSFMLDSIPEFISYIDADLTYRICNRKYELETDISRNELLGKHVTEFIGNEAFGKIQAHVECVLNGKPVTYEDRIHYKYQEEQDVEVQYIPHHSKDGDIIGFLAYIHNITKQRRAEEVLRRQAWHCSLTGLPNRNLLKDCLENAIDNAIRKKSQVGLLFIDLDGFKQVNDMLGHDVGDQVLQEVAGKLIEIIKCNNTLARLGGDEFVILIDDIHSEDQLVNLAKEIVAAISNLQSIALRDVKIGASIGIAYYPDHCSNAQELLIRADEAMYEAKRRGKNGYFLYT